MSTAVQPVPAPSAPAPAAPQGSAAAPAAPATPAKPISIFDTAALDARALEVLQQPAANSAVPAAPAAPAAPATPAAPAAAPTTPAAVTSSATGTDKATPGSGEGKDGAAPATPAPETPAEQQPAAPADQALVVMLPPRNPAGAPRQYVAKSVEEADDLRRLVNGYKRGEEYRTLKAQVSQERQQLQHDRLLLEANPVGFILDRMPADQQVDVARQLLAEHFQTLVPDIEAWYRDEGARSLAQAQGLQSRVKAEKQYERATSQAQQVQQVLSAVEALVPEGIGDADASDFIEDAVGYLARLSDQNGGKPIDPRHVPELLASRVRRYGFAAPATPAPNNPSPSTTVPPASPATPATAQPASQPPASPGASVTNPAALAAARAAASASTPQGVGASPSAIPKPPPGLSIEQTADWVLNYMRQKAS